eukprot:10678233-Lingulodinium_polyedra.AAC.1
MPVLPPAPGHHHHHHHHCRSMWLMIIAIKSVNSVVRFGLVSFEPSLLLRSVLPLSSIPLSFPM